MDTGKVAQIRIAIENLFIVSRWLETFGSETRREESQPLD